MVEHGSYSKIRRRHGTADSSGQNFNARALNGRRLLSMDLEREFNNRRHEPVDHYSECGNSAITLQLSAQPLVRG